MVDAAKVLMKELKSLLEGARIIAIRDSLLIRRIIGLLIPTYRVGNEWNRNRGCYRHTIMSCRPCTKKNQTYG